jgi:hypothetical protein
MTNSVTTDESRENGALIGISFELIFKGRKPTETFVHGHAGFIDLLHSKEAIGDLLRAYMEINNSLHSFD